MAGELLNTEVNYVRILKTLCHKYKSGLEDETQCKMRSILCVTQQLLLDGWTDLHETLGVYITRLGLLHEVLFHFRSEPRNRKCGCFRKPEVGTGS